MSVLKRGRRAKAKPKGIQVTGECWNPIGKMLGIIGPSQNNVGSRFLALLSKQSASSTHLRNTALQYCSKCSFRLASIGAALPRERERAKSSGGYPEVQPSAGVQVKSQVTSGWLYSQSLCLHI